MTGNAAVTLSEVMTRKSKPPIAIYSALADATRCRIVEILLAGPIPVHTLAEAFSISRPAISRHLRVLKTAGLVAEVKKGRENLYALRPSRLAPATTWINTVVAPTSVDAQPDPVPMSAPAIPTVPASHVETLAVEPAVGSEPIVAPERDAARPVLAGPQLQKVERAEKADKTPRVARPEPAVSQMGFDF